MQVHDSSAATAPKRCWVCKETKPHSSFRRNSSRHDGLEDRCRECSKARDKERGRASRERSKRDGLLAFLNNLKATTGCQACGETCAACLDFHHIVPSEKEWNITRLTLQPRQLDSPRTRERVLRELGKCVCLCANCHRKAHAGIVGVSHLAPISV